MIDARPGVGQGRRGCVMMAMRLAAINV